MVRRFGPLLLVLLVPAVAPAQEKAPEQLLPATTQVYLRWDGTAAHRQEFDKTALGKILKGEADAQATEIYAQAFNRDKDFYAFYRRMEAYKQAFGSGGSTMLLSPDNDFLRYFNDPAGALAPKK